MMSHAKEDPQASFGPNYFWYIIILPSTVFVVCDTYTNVLANIHPLLVVFNIVAVIWWIFLCFIVFPLLKIHIYSDDIAAEISCSVGGKFVIRRQSEKTKYLEMPERILPKWIPLNYYTLTSRKSKFFIIVGPIFWGHQELMHMILDKIEEED